MSSSGTISGTPTSPGTSTLSVKVTDAAPTPVSFARQISLTIASPPPISVSLSPSTTTTLDQGQTANFTATLTNDATNQGVTWSVSGSGCSGAACGTFTSTTTTTATYNPPASFSGNLIVFVTATSVADNTKSASSTVVVNPSLSINTTSLPSGTVNATYNAAVAAIGGTGALTWSLVPGLGTLPAGLSLSGTGTISGTPTTAGTSTFSVKATDSAPAPVSATKQLSLTVNPAGSVAVTLAPSTASLIDQGQTVNFTATVANDVSSQGVTWSASGLGCSGATCGTFTNITTTTATYVFPASVSSILRVSVIATSIADSSKSASSTVVVDPSPSITTTSLPNGTVGAVYNAVVTASGGTGTLVWSLVPGLGTLPAGLTLSSSGIISGTPTSTGAVTFSVKVTDSASLPESAQLQLSITVNAPPITVALSPATNSTIDQGQSVNFSATLTGDLNNQGVTWSVSGAGCSGAACGTFTNITTASATYNPPASVSGGLTVFVTATSVANTAKSAASTVVVHSSHSISTTSLPAGTVNASYNAAVAASGGTGTLTWGLVAGSGSLPTGLTLSSSGIIAGTPTSAGTATFSVMVTDSAPIPVSVSRQLSLTVNPAGAVAVTLAPATTSLIDLGQTVNFTATLANDVNNQGVTWSVSGTGCAAAACGTLTNITTTSATYNPPALLSSTLTVSVTATSIADTSKSASSTVVVNPSPGVTTTSLPNGTANATYNSTLNASGGTGTLTWSLVPGLGTLPAGLTLSGTGTISGTPTTTGTSTFTVKVTDSAPTPESAQRQLSIIVNAPPITVALSPAPSTIIDQGQTVNFTATLTGDLNNQGVTWSVAGTGCAGAACGTLTNTTTTSATYNPPASVSSTLTVSVTATSVADNTKSAVSTVVVNPSPSITTTSLPAGTVNAAYNAAVTAIGGTGSLSWSLVAGSGSLPGGLTLSGTGTISGTPTINATSTFSVRVTDSAPIPVSVTKLLSLTVNPAGAVAVSLAPATTSIIDVGQTVNFTATVANDISNQGVTWSVSGTGCSGAACGTFTGNTTASATYNPPASLLSPLTVSVTATSIADNTKSASSTVMVNPAPSITTTSLLPGNVGAPYSVALTASGGTGALTWSLAAGSALPAGLTLGGSGTISGTPTTAGSPSFTVVVTDSAPAPVAAHKLLSILVNPAISVVVSPSGTTAIDQAQTVSFTATLTNDSNNLGATWQVAGAGCSGSACGTLTNVTATTALYNAPALVLASMTVTVTATSVADITKSASGQVVVNPDPTVTTTSLPSTKVGQSYSTTLAATGGTGTLTWSLVSGLGTLPAGLTLSSAGLISGTATTAGTSTFTVKVTDSAPTPVSTQQALLLDVNPATVTGIAAMGVPIPGATVNLVDSAGHTGTATTAGDGTYSINVTGFTPPYLVQVPTGGTNLYSVSADTQLSTTINADQYSDLLIRSWYALLGQSIDTEFAGGAASAPPPTTVGILNDTLIDLAGLWVKTAGLNPITLNLVSTPFAANGSGLDQVLDDTQVTFQNSVPSTLTIANALISETCTITYNTSASTMSSTCTTTNPGGRSVTSFTAVVPATPAQQNALASIDATVGSMVNTINLEGPSLTGNNLLSYLDPSLLQDGLDQSQYAAQLAATLGGAISAWQLQTIKSLDTVNGKGNVVYSFTVLQNGTVNIITEAFQFADIGGTWLITGDNKIAAVNVQGQWRTYQGTAPGSSGASLNAAVVATTGTLSGATVQCTSATGCGSLWTTATSLPETATVPGQVVNLDQFVLNSGTLTTLPPIGTTFTFIVTPNSGPVGDYTASSFNLTTEPIAITSPTNSSLASANLGLPLTVSWTFPSTFIVGQVIVNGDSYAGDPSIPSTPVCTVSQNPGADATSTTLTLPATCNSQAVQFATVGVTVIGTHGENSQAIMGFGTP